MTSRTNSRRGRMGRLRRRARPEYLLVVAVVAAFLAFQTWSEHRLDDLRRERIELEVRIDATRAALAAAQSEFARQSAQDVVVARAREELGLVDCRIGERARWACAVPAAATGDEPWLFRLASGLDRFGGIREAFAAGETGR